MQIPSPTSRRAFLRLTSLGAGGLVLAACAPAPAASPTAAPAAAQPTAAPAAAQPTAAPAAAKPTVALAAQPAPTTVPAAATAAVSAASGAKGKLSISHIGGGSLDGSEKSDRMKQLRATFPNLEIENRWMSYSAYVDKISLITSTGDLADLQFANAFNDVPLMMDSQLLLETGPLLDKAGTHIKAATPAEAWDSTNYGGKQYAAAHNIYDLNVWGIYYRKDWLDNLGAKIPQTLDEYAQLLKDMTLKDPSKGVTKQTFGRMFLNSIKFDDDLFHAFDVAVGHHANGFWRDRGGKLALDWVHPNMKTAWGRQSRRPRLSDRPARLLGPALERRQDRNDVLGLDLRGLNAARHAQDRSQGRDRRRPRAQGPGRRAGLHRRRLPLGLRHPSEEPGAGAGDAGARLVHGAAAGGPVHVRRRARLHPERTDPPGLVRRVHAARAPEHGRRLDEEGQ
jgi:hypothetical protein